MITIILCAYSFIAGMVACRVWRRIKNQSLSPTKKAFVLVVWSTGWIVTFPLLGLMEEINES